MWGPPYSMKSLHPNPSSQGPSKLTIKISDSPHEQLRKKIKHVSCSRWKLPTRLRRTFRRRHFIFSWRLVSDLTCTVHVCLSVVCLLSGPLLQMPGKLCLSCARTEHPSGIHRRTRRLCPFLALLFDAKATSWGNSGLNEPFFVLERVRECSCQAARTGVYRPSAIL